jgi:acetyltransferase-like isoleucine patch superfamily enzyme
LLHQGEVSAPIRIGTQVWIAAHSIILKGRTLGDHCVVGAGAVVTRDVAPGEVAVGNPAKPL